jgi:hypothetical protein
LEDYTFDQTGENITMVLSPEAEAMSHAWLRRNQIASDAGLNTPYPGPTDPGTSATRPDIIIDIYIEDGKMGRG